MIRLGLALGVAAMTSSNCGTSPRITRTCLPRSSNEAAPGLMSMQTISSPRAASRRITRVPMNPVPPMTKIAMVPPLVVLYVERQPEPCGLRNQLAWRGPTALPIVSRVQRCCQEYYTVRCRNVFRVTLAGLLCAAWLALANAASAQTPPVAVEPAIGPCGMPIQEWQGVSCMWGGVLGAAGVFYYSDVLAIAVTGATNPLLLVPLIATGFMGGCTV